MSKIDKGTIYEEYICNYINNSKNNNITAYLWKDVPDFILFNAKLIDNIDDCRINRETCKNYIHDIGIDIIQINNDTNKISFIQCKNYEGSLCIKDLAGYFAIMAQSEHYDKEGIIYTSNNKYSYNLMKVCKGRTHTFIHLPIENNIIIPKNLFVPYTYQLECVEKFNEYYSKSENNSAILQMPCGCGKTFTSFLISENYNIIIIISPLKQHTEQNILNFKKYNKCLRPQEKEEIKSIIVDSEGTRNLNYIIDKIKKYNNIIIGSTYKSCDIIVEIIKKYKNAFIIIDEFHNLSCNNIINDEDNINKIIKSENKKLFMSATPRIYELEDNTQCDSNFNIENILGKIVYKMDFNYAITNNYISNYEIFLPVHDEDNYNQLLDQIKISEYDDLLIKKVLYYFESIKILGKLKTIIYFNSHEHINIFIKCFNEVNNYYNYKYNIDSIICSDTKNNRIKKLEEFNNSENISILCSVGILDECIDIPSCDSVYITYNCVSKIRIIQRISRSLRKHNNKIAKILIWCENINTLNPIISAIKEIDDDIIKKIKYINYNNKILSLDEKNNIQKYNKYKNHDYINNIVKYTNDKINNLNENSDNNNFCELLKIHTDIDDKFIDLFLINFKNNNKFDIKDIDVAKYLDIELKTLRKRLNNTFSKSINYIENVDYIKLKTGKTTAVVYMLNYQCFERLTISGDTQKSEIIREYFTKISNFMYEYNKLI
uniref:Helicase ATP-binding domain-containing protein n=1 Tax=viral metagenome TaxID=1070528 RepID=A0A6C0EF59_9ZZZZ